MLLQISPRPRKLPMIVIHFARRRLYYTRGLLTGAFAGNIWMLQRSFLSVFLTLHTPWRDLAEMQTEACDDTEGFSSKPVGSDSPFHRWNCRKAGDLLRNLREHIEFANPGLEVLTLIHIPGSRSAQRELWFLQDYLFPRTVWETCRLGGVGSRLGTPHNPHVIKPYSRVAPIVMLCPKCDVPSSFQAAVILKSRMEKRFCQHPKAP